MGKRKKIDDRVGTPPLAPDSMPCTFGVESSSRKREAWCNDKDAHLVNFVTNLRRGNNLFYKYLQAKRCLHIHLSSPTHVWDRSGLHSRVAGLSYGQFASPLALSVGPLCQGEFIHVLQARVHPFLQRFLHSTYFKGYKPFSPSSSVMDSSLDRVITRSSPAHHRHNLSRSMLLKRSRNRQGHHYWRNSGVHLNPSTSYGKVTPSWEEKLSFNLDSRQNSDHPHFTVVDSDRSFVRPERIRSSSFLLDADSLNMAKLPCPICSKWLRRKPYVLASSHSGEHDVAAVLVCGHIYHADCLEQETPTENKSDPPCTVCLGFA